MNALLKKDFMTTRSTLVYMTLLAAIFGIAFGQGAPSATCIITVMMLLAMVGTSFTYDEAHQWNVFAVSSGIDRRSIVRMKFTLGGIMVVIGLCIGLAMYVIRTLFDGGVFAIDEILNGVLFSVSFGIAMISINCLINYVFDSVKAQMTSTAMMVVFMSAVVALSTLGMTSNIPWMGSFMVLVAALVLFAASYTVSMNRFLRKDL